MITELRLSDFQAAVPLFDPPYMKLVIEAMAAGNCRSRMWVDQAVCPSSAFLWNGGPGYYFAGRADNGAFNKAAGQIIREHIAPMAGSYLVVYYSSVCWEEELPGIFGSSGLHKAQRCFYELRSPIVIDWRQRVPQEFSVVSIDTLLLSRADLADIGGVMSEIQSMWPSIECFLKNGFGFCAVHDNDGIASWCTGEYAFADSIGVGIETVERHRRKGLATVVASAFAEHCLSNAIRAHWDCWATNTPSVRVAEKVGFDKVLEYSVYKG